MSADILAVILTGVSIAVAVIIAVVASVWKLSSGLGHMDAKLSTVVEEQRSIKEELGELASRLFNHVSRPAGD